MAEWSVLLTVAIPVGSLLVAGATFWTNRQSRKAEATKDESQKAKEEKVQALSEARETGRREALRLVEETRQSHLLGEVEQANRLMGTPAEMAAWKERVDQSLRDFENLEEWRRLVENRLADLDGKSLSSFRAAARDDSRGGENTPAPITPHGGRRRRI